MELLRSFMVASLRGNHDLILEWDEENRGRERLRAVPGREQSEDVEAGIDEETERRAREATEQWNREHPDFPIRSYTEQYPEGYGSGNPAARLYWDPLDGTDEYLNGLDCAIYSAVSAFEEGTFRPLAAVTLDAFAGKVYSVGESGQVTIEFLRSGRVQEVRPLTHTTIPERGAFFAYMGRARYLLPWVRAFRRLISQRRYAGLTLHGKGGSFVYSFLAAGKAFAYAMPNEPVSEVLPGLAFAQLTGCAVLVQEERGWVPFTIREHGALSRVPFLVAGCTNELAHELASFVPQGP